MQQLDLGKVNDMDFEKAIALRDQLKELERQTKQVKG